jgi:hypothetical protein
LCSQPVSYSDLRLEVPKLKVLTTLDLTVSLFWDWKPITRNHGLLVLDSIESKNVFFLVLDLTEKNGFLVLDFIESKKLGLVLDNIEIKMDF